jgi:AAA+ ATPase superfamily predicted ATPase
MKVILITGRQAVGKTTLIKNILENPQNFVFGWGSTKITDFGFPIKTEVSTIDEVCQVLNEANEGDDYAFLETNGFDLFNIPPEVWGHKDFIEGFEVRDNAKFERFFSLPF